MLSYILGISGAVSFLLVLKNSVTGLWLGLGNQFVWTFYALTTGQYGFLFSVALFGPINMYGLIQHFKKKGDSNDE